MPITSHISVCCMPTYKNHSGPNAMPNDCILYLVIYRKEVRGRTTGVTAYEV